ncbi:MAG: nitroreductase [Chloroflexi bacterium]|nr:nitroreductase [Chloroflexota bacterium]
MCRTCTIQLVRIAYGRAFWFRTVREPLKAGMVVLGWLHGLDLEEYHVPSEGCRGCLRFIKLGLREKSGLFRWLNARVNPRFDRLLESIVTASEVAEAKRTAAQAFQRPSV